MQRNMTNVAERVCPIKLTEVALVELHARQKGMSKSPFVTGGIAAVICYLEASAGIVELFQLFGLTALSQSLGVLTILTRHQSAAGLRKHLHPAYPVNPADFCFKSAGRTSDSKVRRGRMRRYRSRREARNGVVQTCMHIGKHCASRQRGTIRWLLLNAGSMTPAVRPNRPSAHTRSAGSGMVRFQSRTLCVCRMKVFAGGRTVWRTRTIARRTNELLDQANCDGSWDCISAFELSANWMQHRT